MNKHNIIAILFFLGISSVGFSQFEAGEASNSSSPSKYRTGAFEYGLQNSFNFTSLVGQYPSTESNSRDITVTPVGTRFTFDFGMFGNYYVTEKVSVQFELNLSYMGAHTQTTQINYHDLGMYETTTSKSYALRYIKIPVTANYLISDNFYVQFGGYFSSLLSAKTFNYNYGIFDRTRIDANPIDAGIIGGVGFDTKIVRLSMRYSYGFMNVRPEDVDDMNVKNSVFQIVAHWKIYSDVRKRAKYDQR